MRGQWPLAGRADELEQIVTLLRDPAAPGVVLSGPAGVGKTRLASETLAGAGRRVVRVSATRAAAGIPLGAFAPYLPATGLSDAADRNALRIAADALVAGAGGEPDPEPPVIFVDDAHALDDASSALLLHLAVTQRVFLLVTLRTGEPIPDALRHLWKDMLPRIDLDDLDLDAVTALLEAELGGAVDGATTHAIHQACQGNALYLRELLPGLVDSGALDGASGMWTLRGAISAPPRLVELVTARLEGLTGRERFVLQALSLTEPMGVPIIEGLGWANEWASLEGQGLAEIRRSGRRQQLFVAHPLHAEVLRATITTRRRNAIMRESAAGIAFFEFRRRDDARRVAVWYLEAGEPADPAVLLAAARDTRLVADNVAAERFARAALEAGGGAPAALVLGLALDGLGRYAEAEVALEEAERTAGTDELATDAATSRSGNMFRGLVRADDARRIIEVASARVNDPLLRDQLAAEAATFSLFEGDVPTTLTITDPLLARTGNDDLAYCIAALPAAMIRVLSGRLEEANQIAVKAFESRVRIPDAVHLGSPGTYLVAQAMALCELGQLDQAIATAQFTYDAAAAEQERNGMAWLACALGRVHLLTGRLATAARFGHESALLFGELAHPGARWGYGLVALANAQRGLADEADEALADLDAEPATTLQMMDSELERARAWVLAARGDLPRARAALLAAADRTASAEMFTLEAALLHDVARLGDAAAVAGRLEQQATRVDGQLMEARVAFAMALAGDDAAALDNTATRFEAFGANLFAAEAANEAAIAYRKAGASRPAASAAQRAARLSARCEGARTPALLHGTGTAVLTKREREVATLASHGMSSREIASTLYVSVRTVENHLQRAYEKLGVAGRAELGDALARAGY